MIREFDQRLGQLLAELENGKVLFEEIGKLARQVQQRELGVREFDRRLAGLLIGEKE